MVFRSLKNILSQNKIYKLSLKIITTDTELKLINVINNNYKNVQRIDCCSHLIQNLMLLVGQVLMTYFIKCIEVMEELGQKMEYRMIGPTN